MKTLLLFIFFIVSTTLLAQSGSPDKSFGQDGKVLDTSIWADCRVVITQPDGKILTGGFTEIPTQDGGLYIARFNNDGSVDQSFGKNGKFMVSKIQGAIPIYVQALSVLPDNKILGCGRFVTNSPNGGVGLLRLFPDGRIDSSFGVNGFITTRLSHWNDIIGGMAVQQDGKIVVSGNKQSSFSQPGPDFLIRYNANGSPDTHFGENGLVYTTFNSNIIPGAIKILPDGKILTGDIYGSTTQQFQLVRYNTDGSLDLNFGINGIARLAPQAGYFSSLNDIAIQDDGKIIVAGEYPGAMALARFDSAGKVDTGFGNFNGYTYFYTQGTFASAHNVFTTPDKKIIMTGSYINKDDDIAVVAYNENGRVDSLFGVNGLAVGSFENLKYAADLTSGEGAMQRDGKIIVSGSFLLNDDNTYNVGLFRYNGETDNRLKYVRIKHWLHHHGITWEDKPNNLINYYSIQSSTNGNAFTEVARIFSNHHGGIQTYTAANNATANYRVAAVSNTGNITYSNTLTLTATPTIQLYPNPAKNILQIQGLPAGITKLTVTDLSGNTSIIATTNSTVYSINIAQLTSGNYLLNIKTANEVITKQFIKE